MGVHDGLFSTGDNAHEKEEMSGKGDRDRTSDREAYERNYMQVFRPKEPMYSDILKYESAYRGKQASTQGDSSGDAGSTPASSTTHD